MLLVISSSFAYYGFIDGATWLEWVGTKGRRGEFVQGDKEREGKYK